jgi:hypothetical protein
VVLYLEASQVRYRAITWHQALHISWARLSEGLEGRLKLIFRRGTNRAAPYGKKCGVTSQSDQWLYCAPDRAKHAPIKKPHRSEAFYIQRGAELGNLNFFSLHAFLAFGSYESNRLTFFQAFETIRLDSFEVYEKIVAARLWSDEAVAFFIVEPLNGTSLAIGHGVAP